MTERTDLDYAIEIFREVFEEAFRDFNGVSILVDYRLNEDEERTDMIAAFVAYTPPERKDLTFSKLTVVSKTELAFTFDVRELAEYYAARTERMFNHGLQSYLENEKYIEQIEKGTK